MSEGGISKVILFIPILFLLSCRQDCIELFLPNGHSVQLKLHEFYMKDDCAHLNSGQVICDVVEARECL